MKRLHVTGCRRSGTTLMFEMLTACFVHDGRSEHEESLFRNPTPLAKGLYISKKPSDITHLQRVFERDDSLYVIYMLRDPRAVITSIHPSRGDTYFASFERWLRYEAAAKPLKAHPRFIEVGYEDLVREPDRIQTRLQDKFSFLTATHKFSEFDRHAKTSKRAEISLRGLRPVNTDSVDTWQQHLPRLRFQLDSYPSLPQVLVDYGYETNTDWVRKLDNISPLSQRYGETPPPLWQRLETRLRYRMKSRRYLAARK